MIRISRSVRVNEPSNKDLPILNRSQVWQGLVIKGEDAAQFVEAIAKCRVLERNEEENSIVREIELRGEVIQELVSFFPEQLVLFERLSGKEKPGFDSLRLKVGTHPGAVDNKNIDVARVFRLFHRY